MHRADRSSPRGDWPCGSLVGWTTGPGRLARLGSLVGWTTGPLRLALLPEASCVGWTSGPGRLARLFEASWVELS